MLIACPNCQRAATSMYCGTYDLGCVGCCARFITVSIDDRLKHIGRKPGTPNREAILAEVRKWLG